MALLLIAAVALACFFVSGNLLSAPDFQPVSFTPADGRAAQQRLFEVVLRQAGRSARRDPIVITEAEANAFLARHLDQSGLPLSPLAVRFAGGRLTAQGQAPLRDLLKAPVLAQLSPYLGNSRLDRPIWVTVTAKILVSGSGKQRYGKVEVEEFSLGRQPLGAVLFSLLIGPTSERLLKWPVPPVVADIQISDNAIEIRTR
jgi:hypothetical protein